MPPQRRASYQRLQAMEELQELIGQQINEASPTIWIGEFFPERQPRQKHWQRIA